MLSDTYLVVSLLCVNFVLLKLTFMAVPILPIVLAGAQVASNVYGTERTAQKQQELSKYAYRQDLAMWNRQNEYNSPQAQMARLQAAGLNPNLVYGQNAPGNQSGQIPKYNVPQVDYKYGQQDVLSQLGQFQNLELARAQTDNVKAQTENIEQRTVNEGARSWLMDIQGRTGEFDLSRRSELRPYQLDVAKGESRKVDATVEQEFQRLMNMRREELLRMLDAYSKEKQLSIQDVEKETREAELLFKRYQNEWMKAGVTSNDNPILRIIVRMFSGGAINDDALQQLLKVGKYDK